MIKILKRIILLFLIMSIFILCGCIELSRIREVPEQELIIYTGIGCHTYEYSEKVSVCIDTSYDVLQVRTGLEEDYWNTILEGEFEKVTWYDYKIFVLMDDIYYMIDINTYEVAEDMYADPEYELKEYSESEFKELYPDWESFDWYGH